MGPSINQSIDQSIDQWGLQSIDQSMVHKIQAHETLKYNISTFNSIYLHQSLDFS